MKRTLGFTHVLCKTRYTKLLARQVRGWRASVSVTQPSIRCKSCGPHFTRCLAEAESRPAETSAAYFRAKPKADWIQPQHDRMLDIIETYWDKLTELSGEERETVLLGVQNGCFADNFDPEAKVELW